VTPKKPTEINGLRQKLQDTRRRAMTKLMYDAFGAPPHAIGARRDACGTTDMRAPYASLAFGAAARCDDWTPSYVPVVGDVVRLLEPKGKTSGCDVSNIDVGGVHKITGVAGDTVYFGAYSGDVYALSLEDGSVLWSFEADGPIIGGLAALYREGPAETLFVGTDAGILYALDPEDGSEKKRFDAGDSIWSAPLLADGVLYVASINGNLYALDAETLDLIWDAPFEAGHGLISDPVLDDGTVLVGGLDRALYAVDPATGEERWSFEADNWFWGQPLVEDGTVYTPNLDGRLYALDLKDGTPVWDTPFQAEEPLRSAPVLAGDALVIVDRDGNVYGLDPEVGTLKWSREAEKGLQKTVLSNPITDPSALEVEVLISAQGGDLFRLDPTAGSFVEVVTP